MKLEKRMSVEHAQETGLRLRLERLLRMDAAEKPGLYLSVVRNADPLSLNYWLELLFAAGIATLGLVLNSPAVVIGAMLVSPLMGPILAMGLAYAAGDLFLGVRSAINILSSIVVAVVFSAALVWLLPFQAPTQEILNRTQPNLLDLGVALFSGLAGSMTLARGGTGGGVTALPGVAIAVALMPPLCTVGFGLGSGFIWAIMRGAGLLFLTNLVAIVFAAFLVFFLVRMDAPEVRMPIVAELARERRSDPLSRRLAAAGIGTTVTRKTSLEFRVLMLVVVLVGLAVPLRQSLGQLRDETVARAAIAEVVRDLVPRGSVLNRQVEIAQDRVTVGLLVSEEVPKSKIEEAERELVRRTGKMVRLQVMRFAKEEEVLTLRRMMERPVPAAPRASVEEVWKDWRPKFDSALARVWPEESAPIEKSELVFTVAGPAVRVQYKGERPLEAAALEAIRKGLGRALELENVDLEAERVAAPRGTSGRSRPGR